MYVLCPTVAHMTHPKLIAIAQATDKKDSRDRVCKPPINRMTTTTADKQQ